MSHSKERKEKVCLNCTASLHGRYCHICGQENTEPKESFWQLANHFFQDITHFDGKFFSTLRYLIFRPGFLPKEYAAGKRMSYLNPVRMYIFTSALFFLVFALHIPESSDRETPEEAAYNQQKKIYFTTSDPAERHAALQYIRSHKAKGHQRNQFAVNLMDDERPYYSIVQYDSVQATLPQAERDDWLDRAALKKSIELNVKYGGNGDVISRKILETFLHSVPKALIIGLPFLALLLQVLYARRKEFYYVNHIIFIVDFTIAIYIILLATALLGWLGHLLHADKAVFWVDMVLLLSIFLYLYKAMRIFYRQGRGKTILKYILFLVGLFFVFIIMSIILLLTSTWLT